MGGVVFDEIPGQPADVVGSGDAALQFQAALDQLTGAGADHGASRLQRHRRQAFAGKDDVERADQVGGGIHQRTVEIEDNSAD